MKENLFEILTGRSEKHLVESPKLSAFLHQEVLDDFLNLREKAKKEGIFLNIASSFRSFERQVLIWNKKIKGELPLLDQNLNLLDIETLTPKETLDYLLYYSAIPGASRHHWGTDFDVFDSNALPHEDYKIVLTEKESSEIFHSLHNWLDHELSKYNCPFFRPFDGKSTKVSSEPWHISHKKISKYFEELYNLDVFILNLTDAFKSQDIIYRELILENPDYYFENYFFKSK